MGVLEQLQLNLANLGITASIEPARESLAEKVNPFDRTRMIGNVVLHNRLIDHIAVEGIYQSRTKSGPGGSRKVLQLAGVNLDYVVKGKFPGKSGIMQAKLNVKRKGILHPKVVDMHWDGSDLASKLNGDNEIRDILWQSLGELSARDIEVKTDGKAGMAKIHVRDDRQVYKGEAAPFQMYEKIAGHVSALAGM
jgi:hypothetical protein